MTINELEQNISKIFNKYSYMMGEVKHPDIQLWQNELADLIQPKTTSTDIDLKDLDIKIQTHIIQAKGFDVTEKDKEYAKIASEYILKMFLPLIKTSTDIESLKKEWDLLTTQYSYLIHSVDIQSFWNMIWNLFAPHLSNKSELKKEAVREFAKYVDESIAVDKPRNNMRNWAEEYLSSNEKEVSK